MANGLLCVSLDLSNQVCSRTTLADSSVQTTETAPDLTYLQCVCSLEIIEWVIRESLSEPIVIQIQVPLLPFHISRPTCKSQDPLSQRYVVCLPCCIIQDTLELPHFHFQHSSHTFSLHCVRPDVWDVKLPAKVSHHHDHNTYWWEFIEHTATVSHPFTKSTKVHTGTRCCNYAKVLLKDSISCI